MCVCVCFVDKFLVIPMMYKHVVAVPVPMAATVALVSYLEVIFTFVFFEFLV